MPILLDSTSGIFTTGTIANWNHTTNGLNRGLIVYGWSQSYSSTANATYGGNAMTFLGYKSNSANNGYIYLFYISNPTLGVNQVVFSCSTLTYITGLSVSYAGVKQTGQPYDMVLSGGSSNGTVLYPLSTLGSINLSGSFGINGLPTYINTLINYINPISIIQGDNGVGMLSNNYSGLDRGIIALSLQPVPIVPSISNIPNTYFTNNILGNLDLSTFVSYATHQITGYGLTGTLPTGVSFDNAAGIISGTSAITGTYPLVFSATNQVGTTTKNFNLIINSPTAPVMGVVNNITSISWKNINVSMFQYVTQTNQDPILSYNLVGNNLPGLEFNTTTGLLFGSPTKVGVYNLGVNCTDKDGQSNTSNFTLTITPKSNFPIGDTGSFNLLTNTF